MGQWQSLKYFVENIRAKVLEMCFFAGYKLLSHCIIREAFFLHFA